MKACTYDCGRCDDMTSDNLIISVVNNNKNLNCFEFIHFFLYFASRVFLAEDK